MALQQHLIDAIPKRSFHMAINIALLGTKTRVCNDNLLEIIVNRLMREVSLIRLKDLERITFALNIFAFKTKSGIEQRLFEAIQAELESNRDDEIAEFPRLLAQCVRYLAYAGIHSNRLIGQVLEPTNLCTVYGDVKNYDNDIALLDCYARINLKRSYRGPLLTDQQCSQLKRKFCAPNPMAAGSRRLNNTDELSMDIWNCLKRLYGHCDWALALPYYYRPGI